MKLTHGIASSVLLLLTGQSADAACNAELLNHEFRKLASEETENLCEGYQGQVLLIVNTASKCGNTHQYEGLEKLYAEYKDRGVAVLGFPSNDFLGQEPGTEEQIQEFCRLTYGVRFPMFEKTTVKGDDMHAFYRGLADAAGTAPTWNFHKYLIARDGTLIAEFSPRTEPYDDQLIAALNKAAGIP